MIRFFQHHHGQSHGLAFSGTVALALIAWMSPAGAGPLPGQGPYFSQKPMLDVPITDASGQTTHYHGHSQQSTIYSWYTGPPAYPPDTWAGHRGDIVTDAFASPHGPGRIAHVRWWGSYLNGVTVPNPPQVQTFLMTFDMSIGGEIERLLSRDADGVLAPGSNHFTEELVGQGPHGPIYEYNAQIASGPISDEENVGRLKIAAKADLTPAQHIGGPNILRWGWHSRDYTQHNTLAKQGAPYSEHLQGTLPPDTPVWHFGDGARTQNYESTYGLGGSSMYGSLSDPLHYLDGIDGPPGPAGIGQHASGLAFELFVIPEPATLSLLMLGTLTLARRRQA